MEENKILFNSELELVDWLFDFNKTIGDEPIDSINDLAPTIGIEFINKYDITGNVADDGEWAGKEYYQYCNRIDENLPKSYPVLMVLNLIVNEGNVFNSNLFLIDWVYKNDFEK